MKVLRMKSSIVENVRTPGGSILELVGVPKSAIKRNNKQHVGQHCRAALMSHGEFMEPQWNQNETKWNQP